MAKGGTKKTVVSKSSAARSPSPDAMLNSDIPPIAYESEQELLVAFDKMRKDIQTRVETKYKADKPAGVSLQSAQAIVLEQFFDALVPVILSNCTIAGLPYAKYKNQQSSTSTDGVQAFDEELREKVIRYQDQYFDAREENVRKRRDVPENIAKLLKEITSKDVERLTTLEKELPNVVTGNAKPTAYAPLSDAESKAAQANFEIIQSDINRMLVDLPTLKSEAEGSTRF